MTDESTIPAARRVWAPLALAALFLAAALPLIVLGYDRGRAASDQNAHYLGAVIQFSQEWPRFNFADYASSTTPGFLLAAAAVHRFVTQDVRALRLFSAGVTAGMLGTLAWFVGRRGRIRTTLAMCLPVACSLYVYSSGVWLLPDNAGWWGVLAVVLLALHYRPSTGFLVAGGALLAGVVLVRQINLWTAAVLWVAAWLGQAAGVKSEPQSPAGRETWGATGRVGLMAAATGPAFLVVAWFAWLWHGLVPPRYQDFVQGSSAAAAAAALAVLAVIAGCYLPMAWESVRTAMASAAQRRLLGLGLLVGLLLGCLPQSSYASPARQSGLWNLVKVLPTVWNRSPLIWLLAAAGGVVVMLYFVMLDRRDRWVWLSSWCAFLAAVSATPLAWQRYLEPFALILVSLMTSRIQSVEQRRYGIWAVAGPLGLAALLAVVTVLSLWRAPGA